MQHFKLTGLLFLLIIFNSCNNSSGPYLYETDPHYTWGQVIFYGADYKEYGYDENIVSLALFTDQLDTINEGTQLIGIGQYLYIDEIFMNSSDTLLAEGIYHIKSDIEPYTITPGEIFELDDSKYIFGARINYYEPNEGKSVVRYITEGTMSVEINANSTYTIKFSLQTKDGQSLNGYTDNLELPHYDDSLIVDENQFENIKEKRFNRSKNSFPLSLKN